MPVNLEQLEQAISNEYPAVSTKQRVPNREYQTESTKQRIPAVI